MDGKSGPLDTQKGAAGRTAQARILPDGPRSSPDNDNGRYGHNHQAGVVELGFAAKKPEKGRIIIIGSSFFL